MSITDNQKIVQELANKVAMQELRSRAREIDASRIFPRDGMRALADAGFLGLTVPESRRLASRTFPTKRFNRSVAS